MSDQKRNQRKFPHEIKDLEPKLNKQMKQDFRGKHFAQENLYFSLGFRSGFIQIGSDKWLLAKQYESEAAKIYNFDVRSDDVWIVTFPRSGTTWTQEMIWLIANDLDYEKCSNTPLNKRFPFLE